MGKSPPEDLVLDRDGNPLDDTDWNTVCPVAAMETLQAIQGEPFKLYAKWFSSKGRFGQNIGDVASFANEWLSHQGVPGPFDRNSGRKSLSRWLDLLHVPYKDHLHIHGDLETVWRSHYQRKLLKSGCRTRKQSEDPDIATKALRLFAQWLHDTEDPKPSLKEQLAAIMNNLD